MQEANKGIDNYDNPHLKCDAHTKKALCTLHCLCLQHNLQFSDGENMGQLQELC